MMTEQDRLELGFSTWLALYNSVKARETEQRELHFWIKTGHAVSLTSREKDVISAIAIKGTIAGVASYVGVTQRSAEMTIERLKGLYNVSSLHNLPEASRIANMAPRQVQLTFDELKLLVFEELYNGLPKAAAREVLIETARELVPLHKDANLILQYFQRQPTRV